MVVSTTSIGAGGGAHDPLQATGWQPASGARRGDGVYDGARAAGQPVRGQPHRGGDFAGVDLELLRQ